ncbi:hypothetical protein HDK90DRAFT_500200 [Phyllosticta capitalensis]|uniref:Uncharacterized protein n=1 Tax=Phyllosticta capitalensis TaxID=121624 RepID=A0ABR1Y8G9_9PEZI
MVILKRPNPDSRDATEKAARRQKEKLKITSAEAYFEYKKASKGYKKQKLPSSPSKTVPVPEHAFPKARHLPGTDTVSDNLHDGHSPTASKIRLDHHRKRRDQYHLACFVASASDHAPTAAVLDEILSPPVGFEPESNGNYYTFGRLFGHFVVIISPSHGPRRRSFNATVTSMLGPFPQIHFYLAAGIDSTTTNVRAESLHRNKMLLEPKGKKPVLPTEPRKSVNGPRSVLNLKHTPSTKPFARADSEFCSRTADDYSLSVTFYNLKIGAPDLDTHLMGMSSPPLIGAHKEHWLWRRSWCMEEILRSTCLRSLVLQHPFVCDTSTLVINQSLGKLMDTIFQQESSKVTDIIQWLSRNAQSLRSHDVCDFALRRVADNSSLIEDHIWFTILLNQSNEIRPNTDASSGQNTLESVTAVLPIFSRDVEDKERDTEERFSLLMQHLIRLGGENDLDPFCHQVSSMHPVPRGIRPLSIQTSPLAVMRLGIERQNTRNTFAVFQNIIQQAKKRSRFAKSNTRIKRKILSSLLLQQISGRDENLQPCTTWTGTPASLSNNDSKLPGLRTLWKQPSRLRELKTALRPPRQRPI